MVFREVFAFEVVHAQLGWPWITFAACGTRFAFASSRSTIASCVFESENVAPGPTFALPSDLPIARAGLAAFSLARDGKLLAVTGTTDDALVVATITEAGEQKRVSLESLVGPDHEVKAIAFDRSGARLWLSLENAKETVLVLVDAASLEKIDVLRSAPFPRPALHELYVHSKDDAVLLVAACGEEGTFARVAGFAGGVTSAIPTAIDNGSVAAGFVGFSADSARLHLVEADELRTHAWPGLEELSSVPLADDFVSSFSGAIVGDDIFIDGQTADSEDDAVMRFDRSAIDGVVLRESGPSGMWAGHLRPDAIVTVESKGEPARGRVWRVTLSKTN